MDKLQVSATFPDISPDKLDQFKQLAAEMLELTRGEQGTLQYDFFLNADETTCLIRESYTDSDAHLAHVGNMGERLPQLMELGGGLVDAQIFGNPTAAHREALAGFAPTHYSYLQGL